MLNTDALIRRKIHVVLEVLECSVTLRYPGRGMAGGDTVDIHEKLEDLERGLFFDVLELAEVRGMHYFLHLLGEPLADEGKAEGFFGGSDLAGLFAQGTNSHWKLSVICCTAGSLRLV